MSNLRRFDPYNVPWSPLGNPVRRAPLDIAPTRWSYMCIDCERCVETDSTYLHNLQRCGSCVAELEAEQLADLRDDEREES